MRQHVMQILINGMFSVLCWFMLDQHYSHQTLSFCPLHWRSKFQTSRIADIRWPGSNHSIVHIHPKTLCEMPTALSLNRGSFPSNSNVSATFSFWIHSGNFWNPTNCEKFNADGSLTEGRYQILKLHIFSSMWSDGQPFPIVLKNAATAPAINRLRRLSIWETPPNCRRFHDNLYQAQLSGWSTLPESPRQSLPHPHSTLKESETLPLSELAETRV